MIWALTFYCAVSAPSCGEYVALRNRYEFQTEDSCVNWAKMYLQAIYNNQGRLLNYSCRQESTKLGSTPIR
jgi:hypothetical protein